MRGSVKRISELAGVSPSTVSNILNGKKSASRETTERVFNIAKELGYQFHTYRTNIDTVNFIFYKKHGQVLTNTPFFTALMEGIERSCRTYQCKMQVLNVNCVEDDVDKKLEDIFAVKNAGLIVMATEMDAEDAGRFVHAPVPIVMLDGWNEDYDFSSVLINNSDAAYKAVCYLIGQGHKKIGYLQSSVNINNFYYRFLGFRRALEKHHLSENMEQYFCQLPPRVDSAYKRMHELLDSGLPMPTAYFADNDEIAIGAMKAMVEKGIRIPEDVSLIGMDDMPYCEITTPRLTTMRVFKEKMGELAVSELMNMVKSESAAPVKVQVGTELIIRDSVRKLN